MPVNRPQPSVPFASTSATPADGRVYLRDQDLDQGAALIRGAAQRLARLAQEAASPHALSGPELDVLIEIHDHNALDVSDLRERLNAPKQSMARNLNDLERKGLTTRETDPGDKRRRLVTLTPDGAALARKITERRRAVLRSTFLAAGPEAVTGARRLLSDVAPRPKR